MGEAGTHPGEATGLGEEAAGDAVLDGGAPGVVVPGPDTEGLALEADGFAGPAATERQGVNDAVDVLGEVRRLVAEDEVAEVVPEERSVGFSLPPGRRLA